MKNRCVCLFLIVTILVSLCAGCFAEIPKPALGIPQNSKGAGSAEVHRQAPGSRPAGGVKTREIPPEKAGAEKNGMEQYQSLTGYWTLSGPTSCKTGQTYTWKVSDFAAHSYEFCMCVKDGSYSNPNVADVQYDVAGDSRTVSYTFWFPGTYLLFVDIYQTDSNNNYWYGLASDYIVINVQNAGENTVTRMIRRVAAENKTDDEFQTVLNLHDWVIDHCTYDDSYTWYSADSIFLLGTGVCNSYSRAFALLLKEAGIACRRVSGYAFGDPDAGHAWNAVRINGKWYLFDLTWDDSGDSDSGMLRHLYFAVPDKNLFSLEHTAGKYVGGKVTCNSLDDNYFIHTGSWVDYTADTLSQYREWMDMGLHQFWLDPPDVLDDNYARNLFGMIAAYEMNRTEIPDSTGRTYAGEFEYDPWSEMIYGFHYHLGWLVLPENLREVSAEAFSGAQSTYVYIQDGCKSLATGAFEGMDLWEVRIPASVQTVTMDAFDENRPSVIMIVAPEGSAAYQFAEEHTSDGFICLSE